MAIDKIFNNSSIDDLADNVLSEVDDFMLSVEKMQKRKVAGNVQLVIQSLRKIENDLRDEYGDVANKLSERIAEIKNGQDGRNGADGRAGKDGRAGRDGLAGSKGADGLPGRDGIDGVDGVSVTDASIDFDGSLIISLSNGRVINVGEVVSQDLADKIQVISTMSTNGAVGIQDEGTTISSGVKNINFVGASVTSTASGDNVTVNIGAAGTGVFDAGTALLPSITTTGDLNTGVYFPAADTVGITTGGAQRGAFSSTGLAVTGAISATGNAQAKTFSVNDTTGVVAANYYQVFVTPANTPVAFGTTTNVAGSTIVIGGYYDATAVYVGTGLGGQPTGIMFGGSSSTLGSGMEFVVGASRRMLLNSTGLALTGTLSTTGVATFAAGTVALPSITTSGDTNTGIYFPAADTVGVTTAGVEAIRIISSGSVGIGGSPTSKLDVIGNTSGTFFSARQTSANASVVSIQPYNASNGGVIYSNWATGNGTLDFGCGSSAVKMSLDNGGNLTTTGSVIHPAGTVALPSITTSGDTNTGVYFPAADTVGITTGGTERMRIDSSGNVLITGSSAVTLEVKALINTASALKLSTTGGIQAGMFMANPLVDHSLGFQTSGTERMRIHSAGGVSIGSTSSPGAGNLLVNGGTITTGSTTSLSLATSGGVQATVPNSGDGSLYVNLVGANAGGAPGIRAAGNTNASVLVAAAGTGAIFLNTGGGNQAQITNTASANRYITLTGSNGGNPTISTSAGALALGNGQLQFPATQNPSSDVNTLDDYEEGTWTPTIYFGGASVGVTYTTQTGTYTKVGNIVCLTANITLSNKGSSTTYAEVRGIPFAAPTILGNGAGVVPYYGSMLGLTGTMTVDVYQSTISLRIFGAVQTASVQDTNFTNTSTITFTCTYYV